MNRRPRSRRRKAADATGVAVAPVQYVVRCGVMRSLGVLSCEDSPQTEFTYGDNVVAATERGTEIGVVLCEATAAATEAMESEPTAGRILRGATDVDLATWQRIIGQTDADMSVCERLIAGSGLEMDLVEVERIFGGEKLIVYYLAPGRVDFRQLVRDLAKQFRTRIEMKQIGVRDEAKIAADYGDCGQPICCSRFLSKMPPVSMKMAKLQKATLDPTKISGRCGRLKCCLRYEFDTYQEAAQSLPPVGSLIVTRQGNATVVSLDLLASMLVVRTDDRRRVTIGEDEVLTILKRGEQTTDRGGSKKR